MQIVDAEASASCAIMNEDKACNGSAASSSTIKIEPKHRTIKSETDFTAHSPVKIEPDITDHGTIKIEANHSPNNESAEPTPNSGGRLKFYKDGKFILELSHRKEGDKDAWVPVQKKSCWHPGVANSTASFSASDDTSSVQLSPWQRDHCWKQSVPRRLRGSQLTFFMMPLATALHARQAHRGHLRRLRRRPHEAFTVPSTATNGWTRPHARHRVKASPTRLAAIVQRIWDIVKSSPSVFSPRKRILREMERVSLVAEEPVKRQRPRAAAAGAGHSKGVSSYSITSLLGPREEESPFLRTLLRSPSPKSRQHSPLSEPYPPSALQPPYMFYPFQSGVPAPPYYVAGSPSHSLWTPYPLSSLPRGVASPYSGLLPSYGPPHLQYPWPSSPDCQLKREDASSDVPLNLSKHGGG